VCSSTLKVKHCVAALSMCTCMLCAMIHCETLWYVSAPCLCGMSTLFALGNPKEMCGVTVNVCISTLYADLCGCLGKGMLTSWPSVHCNCKREICLGD
jgi:hypothetical protein